MPDTGTYSDDNDWHGNLNRFVAAWARQRHTDNKNPGRADRMVLVGAIYSNGGFEIQCAVQYAAELPAVSRATIHDQLANLRKQGASA